MSDSNSNSTHTSSAGDPDRKRRYEQLLAVITRNTGWPDDIQRAGVSEGSLRIHMHMSCGWGARETSLTIRAALEQGAIMSWIDETGTARFARTADEGLRKVIAEQNASEQPNRALIEQCAELLEADEAAE